MTNMRVERKAGELMRVLAPDDDVRTVHRARQVLRADGLIDPERIAMRPALQSRDFVMPSTAVKGQRSVATLQVPQGGINRRMSARSRVAPTGGPATFNIVINGQPGPTISIQPGQFGEDMIDEAATVIPPLADLWVVVVAANGAADVTITTHYEPGVTE